MNQRKRIFGGGIAILAIFVLLTTTVMPSFAEEAPPEDSATIVEEVLDEENSDINNTDDPEIIEPQEEVNEPQQKDEPENIPEKAESSDTKEDDTEKLEDISTTLFAEVGDKLKYETSLSSGGETRIFKIKNQPNFKGTCGQLNVDASSGGTGTIQRKVSNTSRLAKMVYYFDIKKGWYSAPKMNQSVYGYLDGIPSDTAWTYGKFIMSMCQIATDGKSTWIDKWGGASGTASIFADWYSDYDVSDITVPNSFKMYYLTDGSNQPFYIWEVAEEGSLKISKAVEGSTNPTFTFNITVEGAKGTYSDVTFNSSGKATITLSGGQSKTIEGLPADASYTVTEASMSGWHIKSNTGTSGTIPADSTVTASFTNERDKGYIKLKKESAIPGITN